MREDLDRLAPEDDRRYAVATVRGHEDQIAAFRLRGIDDRLIGMLMLDLNRLACDAGRLRCLGGGAKSLLGMLLHARLVPGRRVLDHLHVGRERMKRRQDRQHSGFGADALSQGKAVGDSLAGWLRPVRWYQNVSIHRRLPARRATWRGKRQSVIVTTYKEIPIS